jgi:DNA-binding FadR family transcriptional regulator
MPLTAVRNRSLADQVFHQLAGEIFRKRWRAGASLPAERALTEVFDVNRHVVREALQRLQQIGLVKIAQGGSTQVLDIEQTAGLDLLGLVAEHARGGDDVARIWLSVLEMRAAIAADVARLCAQRAGRELRAELVAIAGEMGKGGDSSALFALEIRFWDRMLQGAANVAYRMAFNSMMKGAYAMGASAAQYSAYEAKRSDYRARIAAAVSEGDAETAETETRKAMRAAVDAFAKRNALTQPMSAQSGPTRKRKAARRTSDK